MPIDELVKYWPKIKLPVYTKITDPKYNDFDVGNEYRMRIEDPERLEEKDESGPYNYIHECILIAKEETQLSELSNLLIAFDAHTRDRDNALYRLGSDNETWGDDKNVVLLVFLRKDAAKEFITSDIEILEAQNVTEDFTKEDAENE